MVLTRRDLTTGQRTVATSVYASVGDAVILAVAGAGKTAVLTIVAAALAKNKGEAVIVATPTGQAAEGAPPCSIPGMVMPARTAHYFRMASHVWDHLAALIKDGKIAMVHIFVDEAPMLCSEDFAGLYRRVQDCLGGTRARHRFVLCGDQGQLPSVGTSMFSSKLFWSFLNKGVKFYTLTEAVRFGVDSEMIALAQALTNRDANRVQLWLRSRWVSPLLPCPAAGVRGGALFISYCNETVDKYNAAGFHGAVQQGYAVFAIVNPKTQVVRRFVRGGRIVATKNRSGPDGEFLVANGTSGFFEAITGTLADSPDPTYPTARVYVEDKHLAVDFMKLDGSIVTLSSEAIKRPAAGGAAEFKLHITPGDAITIHRSQGMTIRSKVVLDLSRVPNWEALTVAVTRIVSIELLYILPFDETILDRVVGSPCAPDVQRFTDFAKAQMKACTSSV